MLSYVDVIRANVAYARKNFLDTVGTVTPEMLHVNPGAKALPLGATWAHIIYSEDIVIHTMLQAKPTLYETTFKDNTGTSMVMPPMDAQWNESHELWAHSVKIDLPKFIEYQKAVFEDTDRCINNINEDDMEKNRDLGTWGQKYTWEVINEFIIAHMCTSTGEIAVLKGLQGMKGLPF